jgi:prevent-host-death family protein
MTQRIPTAEARKGFAHMLRDSAKGERIKLTRYNKTVAVIIPKKDLADLEECEKERTSGQESEQADDSHAPSGRKHGKPEK